MATKTNDLSLAAAPCPTRKTLMAGSAIGIALAYGTTAVQAQAQEAPVEVPAISVEAEAPGTGYKASGMQSPKYSQPLVDIPQTITVIPQEVIEDRGATSLQEVLRTTPGISLGAGEGGLPLGDRAFIRGFDARTDTFVDGFRDFGSYFRDPFNLEQVEVTKGPGSAYAGRGSTGGTINLVTKTPRADAFYAGSASIDNELSTRFTVDLNQPLADSGLEGGAVRLNAVFHEGTVPGRDEVDYERWGIAPSLTLGLGTPTRVTIGYQHFEQDDIPDYGHPFNPATGKPIDVDRDNFYGLTDRDHDIVESDIATLQVTHDLNDSLTLQNTMRYGRSVKDFIVTKPEYTAGDPTVYRSDRSRDSEDEIIANQTNLQADFATGPLRHSASLGLDLTREKSSNQSRSIDDAVPADFDDPDPHTPYNGAITPDGQRAKSVTDGLAIYAFDTVQLTDQWAISGGVRWDVFETDYTNSDGERFERSDSVVSYRAGVSYKPLPNGSIYFSYGTSVNPSAEGLTLSDTNDQLKPEESESYELGTKWELFDRKLLVNAALFRTDKTNARTSTGRGAPQVLDGEQRVQGVEIGLAGNITEDWSVFGGYTFLDSEILESVNPAEVGNEFANIAPHNFSLWTAYDVTDALRLGFGATYSDRRYANNTNDRKLPSYWRFDAMAAYEITENVAVQLNVMNLTDELYYDSTHAGQHALVAPGRTFLVSTNFRF